MTGRRDLPAQAAALGAGALVGFSLPPWGWWPLAIAGLAVLDRLIGTAERWRQRFLRGFAFGLGWLAPGLGWMWWLTIPGYIVATIAYSGYLAAAIALTPPNRWRWLALPGAIVLAEEARFSAPFGGVPLASLGISQVSGPLAPLARIGGVLLITAAAIVLGQLASQLSERRWRPAAVAGGLIVAAIAAALFVAPRGTNDSQLTVALVQGGGPQGTRAVSTDEHVVFARHLAATRLITKPVDLVVWPEDVINVDGSFAASTERSELVSLIAELGVPTAVGVVEDADTPGRFLNAEILFDGTGQQLARYDKVHRVPFGEYMPMRSMLTSLGAPTNLVPKDAIAGTGPAVLDAPMGRLGVVISWEVFFGNRARDAAANGGKVILNPTNGSSYRGTVLQTQQVASSRLRAIETGRYVLQTAPTGFSAIVTPGGKVRSRTDISAQQVVQGTIRLRHGSTWYVRWGDGPFVVLASLVLAAAWVGTVADRRRLAVVPALTPR